MFIKENAWQTPDLSLIPRTTWHPKNLNEVLEVQSAGECGPGVLKY